MRVCYSHKSLQDLELISNKKTRNKIAAAINRYKDYSIVDLLNDPKVMVEKGICKDKVVGIEKDVIRIFLKVDSSEDKVTILNIGNKKGTRGSLKEKKWLKKHLEIARKVAKEEKI